jgi:flagellar basal body-associated protein FliL
VLKQIEKIENLFNKAYYFLVAKLIWLIKMIIPAFVLNFFNTCFKAYKEWVQSVKNKIRQTIAKIVAAIRAAIQWVQETINKLKNMPIKTKVTGVLNNIDQFLKKTPASKYKSLLKEWLQPKIDRVRNYLNNLRPRQIVFFVVLLGLISVGSLQIYVNSAKIYESEFPDRKPAQFSEEIQRPEYYNRQKKLVKITNLKVPLIVTSVTDLQNLLIDINIQCSNRFTRLWIYEHDFEVKDHLFINLEPISPNFSLDEEGKWIIKEKVKDELNYFLQQKGVEGEVEEVHLLEILGT